MEPEKNWIEENLEDVMSYLYESSEKDILNYEGNKVLFHTVDKTIFYLEEALILNERDGVIVYPVNKTEVAVPMCIEALYCIWEKSNKLRKVLLISQNIAVRELYWNLKVNFWRLNNVFPLGIVKADGSIKPQLKTADEKISETNCYFLHTSNPSFLPNSAISREIGCVIVDTNSLAKEDLSLIYEWADKNQINTLIYLESEQDSENYDIYRDLELPIWGWDSESLKQDFRKDIEELEINPDRYSKNPFSFSIFQIKNLLRGIKREFIEIQSNEITEFLKDMLKIYFELKKLCKETKSEPLGRASISFSSCKYSFERMLAPIEDIENQCKLSFMAKTLERRIENLESWGTLLQKQEVYLSHFWGKTYGMAKAIYQKFKENGNPKYEELKKIVQDCIIAQKKLLIFNYNEPYAQALITALQRDLKITEQQLGNNGIWITSMHDVIPEEDFDKCVIFGAVPFRASWLLKTACAKESVFLVYPSEKPLLRQQFKIEERKMSQLFGLQSRTGFIKEITGKNELKNVPLAIIGSNAQSFELKLDEAEIEVEDKIKPLLNDMIFDDDLVAEEELNFEEGNDIDESKINELGFIQVTCCKIDFEDGSQIYVKPSRKLPIFKDGKKIEYQDARRAKVGDTIVLVRQNVKNNLAQQIIKMADRHPKMQRYKVLVNSWVMALRKGMEENNDDAWKFLRKLQEAQETEGIQKITNWFTIELWRGGYVIGPQENKNIKLIGKIYEQKFLIDNYVEIGAAISRLRGIHIKLLRKFNEMALKVGVRGIKSQSSGDVLDEEFNLHVEDFANIVTIHKIKSIELDSEMEISKLDKLMR